MGSDDGLQNKAFGMLVAQAWRQGAVLPVEEAAQPLPFQRPVLMSLVWIGIRYVKDG
jgi:hypothetical protein